MAYAQRERVTQCVDVHGLPTSLVNATCHDVLGCSVSICSHYASGNMSLVPFWTVFGKAEIRQFCIVFLFRVGDVVWTLFMFDQ